MCNDLPRHLQPNPLVNSDIYKEWSDQTQPRNNVHTGPYVWCQEDELLSDKTTSLNQNLAGLQDPKTLVQPLISMPVYDNELWKSNDFMIPMGINDQRRQELSQNGYLIDDVSNITKYVRNMYSNCSSTKQDDDCREDFTFENTPQQQEQTCLDSSCLGNNRSLYPNNTTNKGQGQPIQPPNFPPFQYNQQPFQTEFGYYPDNQEFNVPTNYPAGECELRPEMSEYNENIFTNTLQPGVYSQSQVNQPQGIMSNLGISYTQPFLPTYSSYVNRKNGDGKGVLFTEYDPNFAPSKKCAKAGQQVNESNVYDPRFTGYGTSYRCYIDQLTGRPRYFYDDIDEYRRSKFITRNALDFEDFGLQTGPQPRTQMTNMEVRESAQNAFLDNQLAHRTDLQERQMRKNNERAWQLKKAPIMTNQFNRGASTGTRGISSAYAGPRG